ncbi:DUF6093 family protein [Agromyces sp. NBRC 114283]|uniref:DUF6093 family protein n=1 Tax=Agromyces sp. NBRC 114283 TaxID=2994521 RepID=UPI0024A55429|nr:DUF6093 family protein [Agromyces sp. NBRC 114283]GLU88950.1 hypothetical protein Agsp01_12050 [Agromyces sp. NBRC 114283]
MLGDDVRAALPGLQAHAESLMMDTVRVRRRGEPDPPDPDPVTGEYSFSYTLIYEGKCRLILRSGVVRVVDAASQLVTVQEPRLDVPVAGTSAIEPGDEFEMLSSVDPGLVGVSGVVAGRFDQSLASARRLPVKVGN